MCVTVYACVLVSTCECASEFVCLCLYLCMCVLQSLCQDCTVSWSHPIINTYRSSLGSGDHLVDVRFQPPHISLCLALSLWGFTGKAAYRRQKKAATDRWMDENADRWILSDMTDWLTDSMDRWRLAGRLTGSLVMAVAYRLTRRLSCWLMGPISYKLF